MDEYLRRLQKDATTGDRTAVERYLLESFRAGQFNVGMLPAEARRQLLAELNGTFRDTQLMKVHIVKEEFDDEDEVLGYLENHAYIRSPSPVLRSMNRFIIKTSVPNPPMSIRNVLHDANAEGFDFVYFIIRRCDYCGGVYPSLVTLEIDDGSTVARLCHECAEDEIQNW